MFPSTSKASGGISIVFPSVCRTPVPATDISPIPYPNIAKTALETQKKIKSTVTKTFTKQSSMRRVSGAEAGSLKGVVSNKNMEVTQIKSMLNQINTKIQNFKSEDPNEWQKVVQEYVVAVSALYVTNNS